MSTSSRNRSEVRKDLVERFERGERFVTASHCDNFCEILGCQGHQENA
uniref:Uncharacterized protein n=1 Tax=Escherichia coli TaxID=562 RepID=A0A6G9I2P1_ECOLX|nr:hypothetical protein [Escherichia coli]